MVTMQLCTHPFRGHLHTATKSLRIYILIRVVWFLIRMTKSHFLEKKAMGLGHFNSEMKWMLCSLAVIDYCFQVYQENILGE